MQTALDIPYADARADGLGWSLDLPALPALGGLVVALDTGWSLDLRLLGASHQVLACRTDEPSTSVCEVVACGRDDTTPMPPRMVATTTTGDFYRFRSQVQVLTPERFDHEAKAVVAFVGRAQGGIVGTYPGHPLAVTALLATPLGSGGSVRAGWRTWHAYPQTGEIVITESSITGGGPE